MKPSIFHYLFRVSSTVHVSTSTSTSVGAFVACDTSTDKRAAAQCFVVCCRQSSITAYVVRGHRTGFTDSGLEEYIHTSSRVGSLSMLYVDRERYTLDYLFRLCAGK